MNTKTLTLLHALAAATLALVAPAKAGAQDYPSKPIKFIVPLAAASAVDNAARIVAERMSQNMGQQVVIENIPGAAGLIGAERVAKAAPDGYTFGAFNDSVMTMVPNMYDKMPWDTLKDFDPVSLVGTIEWGLITGLNTPYKTAADLIADARARPGKVDRSTFGVQLEDATRIKRTDFTNAGRRGQEHRPDRDARPAAPPATSH